MNAKIIAMDHEVTSYTLNNSFKRHVVEVKPDHRKASATEIMVKNKANELGLVWTTTSNYFDEYYEGEVPNNVERYIDKYTATF
jgi:hypothetical protein